MLLSDVCLSRTSGLSREQRPRKTKIGTEVAHVTRTSDTTFKVKGRCTRRRVGTSGSCCGGRVGREKLLLCCHLLDRGRHFGAHGGRWAGHIVAAARPQLVIQRFSFYQFNVEKLVTT